MPDSPPKRITRARAKAAETAKLPAKAAVAAPPATRATKSTARRKVALDEAAAIAAAVPVAEATEPVKKTRTRTRKAVGTDPEPAEKQASTDLPAAEKMNLEPPRRLRGRPRKAETANAIGEEPKVELPVAPARVTRARIAAAPAKRTAPVKKKVMFEEPQLDKENRIPLQGVLRRTGSKDGNAIQKPGGLNAKPIRRAATGRSTRGSKKKTTLDETEEPEKEQSRPLSPKKAQQNLIVSSSASEDELAGHKTPIKPLLKSPVKNPRSGATKPDYSLPAIQVIVGDNGTTNPATDVNILSLSSPAKRPPAPLFKNALKDSPKRVNLTGSFQSQSAFKSSASPFKLSHQLAMSMPKSSLLSSPARKFPVSPSRRVKTAAPETTGSNMSNHQEEACSKDDSLEDLRASPRRNLMSAFKPMLAPEQLEHIQKTTSPEKRSQLNMDQTENPFRGLVIPDVSPLSIKDQAQSLRKFNDDTIEQPAKLDFGITGEAASMANDPDDAEDELSGPFLKAVSTQELSESILSNCSTTPPGTPPQPLQAAFQMKTPETQYPSDVSDSEDELQTAKRATFTSQATPTVAFSFRAQHSVQKCTITETGRVTSKESTSRTDAPGIGFTPLAHQLQMWNASTPLETTNQHDQAVSRGMFSVPKLFPCEVPQPELASPPTKSSFFDEAMSTREQDDGRMDLDNNASPQFDFACTEDIAPELSEASQEYGDENAIPIDPAILASDPHSHAAAPTATCTPARVFTRVPQVIHTVTKVPLKAAADDSPSTRPRKRSHSLSGPLLSRSDETQSDTALKDRNLETARTPSRKRRASQLSGNDDDEDLALLSTTGTPARTPRADLNPQTLKGAVVFVDVHTTEGADASGIFVELLTQMGARCVKQWSWNPNSACSSSSSSLSEKKSADAAGVGAAESAAEASNAQNAKIGITHVVFKDGGKRTLEKVRASEGVVLCVGVGWVLDCERHNKWLDEAAYSVDTSLIPRGGQRRRKSMEPRALANINGYVVPSASAAATPAPVPAREDLSPTKQFLNLSSSPGSRRTSFGIPHPHSHAQAYPPRTPTPSSTTATTARTQGVDEQRHASKTPSTPLPLPPPRRFQPHLTDLDAEHEDHVLDINSASNSNAHAHAAEDYNEDDDDDDDELTTPAYLKHPSLLTQRSCPPKQQQPLGSGRRLAFPLSGRIEDHPDEKVRARLAAARRKTLMWRPKVGSPLARFAA